MDINRDNYESFFLLYLDRELKPSEMQAVEKFLSENTDLQKEFEILQQTIFLPEEMIFENKEILFRKEEKRRIIPFYGMRVAAAVAVMILGGWLITTQVINNRARITALKNSPDELKNTKGATAEKSKTADNIIEPSTGSNPGDNSVGAKKDTDPGSLTNTGLNKNDQKQNPQSNIALTNNKNDLTANSKPGEGNGVTVRQQQNQISYGVEDEDRTAVQKNSTGLELQTDESGKTAKQITAAPGDQAPALLIASVNSKDVHEENILPEPEFQSDNSISVIALNENNKGITGFFKKLTKRAPADENAKKVRVSVFQFSY